MRCAGTRRYSTESSPTTASTATRRRRRDPSSTRARAAPRASRSRAGCSSRRHTACSMYTACACACTLHAHAHSACTLHALELSALLLTQECKLASERLGVQVFLDAVDDTVAPHADDGSPSASDSDSEVEGYGLHPRATEGGEEGQPARKGLWRVLKKSIARRDGRRSSTSLRELRAAMRSGELVDDRKGLSPCYTPWMQRHATPPCYTPLLHPLLR